MTINTHCGKRAVTFLTLVFALFALATPATGIAKNPVKRIIKRAAKSLSESTHSIAIELGETGSVELNLNALEANQPSQQRYTPAQVTARFKETGFDSMTNRRLLSPLIEFDHLQTDGMVERRTLRYSTPQGFSSLPNDSVNLWLVLHGGGGDSATMHRYFDVVPIVHPTVIVYPESLAIDDDNKVNNNGKRRWRQIRDVGQATDMDAFRDLVYLDWLISKLLQDNPQLSPEHVYLSGFSSGAGLTWMALCYHSAPIRAFGIYSQPVGSQKLQSGCGNGGLVMHSRSSGYEQLTSARPDPYGHFIDGNGNIQSAPTRPVLYIHGTLDDNLHIDPNDSRPDSTSVKWLIERHQLSDQPSRPVVTVPDEDPNAGNDQVTTRRFDFSNPAAANTSLEYNSGSAIRWYEMQGAKHSVSSLNRQGGAHVSKDYDASLHTMHFFEEESQMMH